MAPCSGFYIFHTGVCTDGRCPDVVTLPASTYPFAPGNMSSRALRILIADDHDVILSGLRAVLEAQTNWQVVAEAVDGMEAVVKAIETKPDVVVLDYSMPLINGVEATRRIRGRLPNTEVLIFTMHDDDNLITQLLAAGARGYLIKSDASRQLVAAVKSLAIHRPYFSSRVSQALLESFLTNRAGQEGPLTPRQRGVVQMIAEGHSNKETARLLNITLKTVESHRSTIMRNLDLHSSASLVRYAIRNKIVDS